MEDVEQVQGLVRDRRKSRRLAANFSVKCAAVGKPSFQGWEHLFHSDWNCVSISSFGATLQTQRKVYNGLLRKTGNVIRSFLGSYRSVLKLEPDQPSIPPHGLGIVLEIRMPSANSRFTIQGKLAWFKSLWNGASAMGVQFDNRGRVVVYDDAEKNLYITTCFPKDSYFKQSVLD